MILESCSWDRPGADRFTGDPVAAVAKYGLPAPVLADLQAKMRSRRYDDIVLITRDKVSSGGASYSDLRMMNFGSRGRVCQTVTRSKWADSAQERALIYCSGDVCVALPTVCGNLSLITKEKVNERGESGGGGLRWDQAPTDEGGHAATWGQGPARPDWVVPNSDGGSGVPANSFAGGSGAGAVWGGAGSHFGGGGGGGSSLTFVESITQVVNNYFGERCCDPAAPVIPTAPASEVPEPAAWHLALAALGVLGFFSRRLNKETRK